MNNNVSRRNFMKASAGVVATIAMMNYSKPSFASDSKVKAIDFENIPIDPIAVAQSSDLVNKSWNYLLEQINEISEPTLRAKVLDLYKNTTPTFMALYPNAAAVHEIYTRLVSENLLDIKLTKEDKLFPPLKSLSGIPQPFFTAPGSGYGSHHAYPGGLVTHTAVNVEIIKAILDTYDDFMGYEYAKDITIAAELLHDLAKPWVFQWQKDGSSLPEYQIAGTGAHHVFSIAEAIYRNLPADEIVAQACAHNHPGTPKDEALVVGWIKAASILANKDPISLGLLSKDGKTLPSPHKQAGYLVHLGDHDFVLSVPAAQQSVIALKEVAKKEYNLTDDDLKGIKFNKLRNYIAAQFSFMHIHQVMSASDNPIDAVAKISKSIIYK